MMMPEEVWDWPRALPLPAHHRTLQEVEDSQRVLPLPIQSKVPKGAARWRRAVVRMKDERSEIADVKQQIASLASLVHHGRCTKSGS